MLHTHRNFLFGSLYAPNLKTMLIAETVFNLNVKGRHASKRTNKSVRRTDKEQNIS